VTEKRKHLYRKPGYVYFRDPRTSKLTPLPLDETSDEFATQYDALLAALNATPAPPRDPGKRVKRDCGDGNLRFIPPTVGWFVEKFLASEYFNPASKQAYAEGTRYNYRKAADLLRARLGTGMLVDLDQEAVEVYSAQRAGPVNLNSAISGVSA
jgi:hypothetical protein